MYVTIAIAVANYCIFPTNGKRISEIQCLIKLSLQNYVLTNTVWFLYTWEKISHTKKKKNQTKKPNQKTKRKFIVLNTFAVENTNYMLRNFKPLINCLNNN